MFAGGSVRGAVVFVVVFAEPLQCNAASDRASTRTSRVVLEPSIERCVGKEGTLAIFAFCGRRREKTKGGHQRGVQNVR